MGAGAYAPAPIFLTANLSRGTIGCMMKLSLAVPRVHVQLIADLIHLNGHKFELEFKGEEPVIIRIHVADAAVAAFDPRETIKPVANA